MIQTVFKEHYLSPQCEVVETETEEILQISPVYNNPFNEEQRW